MLNVAHVRGTGSRIRYQGHDNNRPSPHTGTETELRRKTMDERLYLHKTEIVRWRDGAATRDEDYLSIEEPLALIVNGVTVAVLMRLPGAEKELAAGFLVSEGIVPGFEDIQMLSHCGSLPPGEESDDPLTPSRNIVTVTSRQLNRRPDAATMLIRSGCGRTGVDEIADQLPTVTGGVEIGVDILTATAKQILALQAVRQMAGGVHLAALFDTSGRQIISFEDVGRHNAADKVLGFCLLREISLDDKILYITGRASYEMVIKAARMNIPVLASKSSPTSLAVQSARTAGLTLCGFVRPSRVNIYSGEHRILL